MVMISLSDNLVGVRCFKCACVFYVSEVQNDLWRTHKHEFFCPNGHGQSYVKTKADLLQEQLDQKRGEVIQHQSEIFELGERIASLERKLARSKRKK